MTNDGKMNSAAATVSITVRNSNRAPAAKNDTATSIDGAAVIIPVLANDTDPDNDPLTVASVTSPLNGTAVINGDQTVTYTPNAGFVGSDTFNYVVSDGRGGTATATVSVNCTLNHAPKAVNDVVSVYHGVFISFNIVSNDSDQDGDPITVTSVTPTTAGNGAFTWAPDGTMTYQSNASFKGKGTLPTPVRMAAAELHQPPCRST